MDWGNFHFLRPWWFLALIPVFALGWVYWIGGARSGAGEWRKLVDENLLPALISGAPNQQSRRSISLAVLAGVLAVTALAGPAWKRLPQPLYEARGAMVVILDLSRSMLATDLKPNRLMRARLKLIDLLRKRKEGETGLVVFAGAAFTVSPLTDDVKTIQALVQDLSINLMPVQGSRMSVAIQHAVQLMKQAGHPQGSIVILADGGDASSLSVAAAAKKAGYRVSIIGVGTAKGAPAPLARGGFITDASSQVVMHKLDETFLQNVTRAGGGAYASIATNDTDLRTVLSVSEDALERNRSVTKKDLEQDQWREEGPWLLLLLAPLAAFAFRRGYLLLLVFLLPMPEPAQAADIARWFQNGDQQAKTLLEQGEAEQAARAFRDPDWKASALYEAGQYEKALKLWRESKSPDANYNRGNALARSGNLKQAISAYDEAIRQDPENTDAIKNRELVKKLLEQQSKKNSQQNKSSESNQQSRENKSGDQNSDSRKQEQKQKQGQKQKQKQKQKEDQGDPGDQSQNGQEKEKSNQSGDQENQKGRQGSSAEKRPEESGKAGKDRDAQGSPEKGEEPQSDRSGKQKLGTNAEKQNVEKSGGNDKQDAAPMDEESKLKQMDRQSRRMLRKIPDDPGGLMRRKFLYQYRQRGGVNGTGGEPW